jgi:hypothetical protein
MMGPRLPWDTRGARPLRLPAPRGEQPTARRRVLELPTTEERETRAKAQRAAARERVAAALGEGLT